MRTIPICACSPTSVCYVSEAQCLYLFAYSSLERYHAVAAPLKWRTTNTTAARRLAIVVGFVVGMISSTLNIIMISIMDDKDIMKTCTITELPSQQTLPLHFLIGIKFINLLCVYCLPCSVLILANIFIIVAGKHRSTIRSSKTRRTNKKLSYVFSFLVFSSLFMMCCLPRPIFDLNLAFDVLETIVISMSPREMIADAVIWNLTTLAFALNTVVGMRYTV